MLKFRSDSDLTPLEAAEKIKGEFESLRGQIDGLLELEAGINRNESKTSYDLVLTMDFRDWESLAAYKVDPLHLKVSELSKYYRESRARVDYER